jgi:hypothetical protein
MGKSKRMRLAGGISGAMFGLGITALLISVIYTSTILAFVGLGLTFWGAVLLYIPSEEHIQRSLLDAILLPSLVTLSQTMQQLALKGNPIYLPPKYFEDPEATKIYIPKQKDAALHIELFRDQLIVENPRGLLLTPPGAELARLFEKTLETSFNKVDLEYLQKNMPRLFIEDLEIAENLELQVEKGTVYVRVTNSICKEIHNEGSGYAPMLSKIGCPVCSAIACALTKATGKPITDEGTQLSENGKTIETTYRILETAEPQEQIRIGPEAQIAKTRHSRLSDLVRIALVVMGSAILLFVVCVTCYDAIAWGKNLALVFLGPRTGEAMDLGIGMRVLYYFVLGLALLLIGVFMLFRRRRNKKTARF